MGLLDDLAVGRFEDGAVEGLGGVDGGEVVRGILEQGDDFLVVAVVVPGRVLAGPGFLPEGPTSAADPRELVGEATVMVGALGPATHHD